MNSRAVAEKTTSLFFIALSAAYILAAKEYAPGARLIPTIVAFCTIVVATIQLLAPYLSGLRALVQEDHRSLGPANAAHVFADRNGLRQSGAIVAWALLLHFLIYTLGFVVATPLFMAVFLAVVDRKSWVVTLVMTAVLGGLAYLLMVGLLELPWNEGMLWSLGD